MYEQVINVLEKEMNGVRERQDVLAVNYTKLTDQVTFIREEQKQLSKSMTFKKGMLTALREINKYEPFNGLKSVERTVTITPTPDIREIPERVDEPISEFENQGKGWTTEESNYVMETYTKIPTSEIAKALKRTESAIINHAYVMQAPSFKERKKQKYESQ